MRKLGPIQQHDAARIADLPCALESETKRRTPMLRYTPIMVDAAIFLLRRPADGSGVNTMARQQAKNVLVEAAADLEGFASKKLRTRVAQICNRKASLYRLMVREAE